MSDVNEIIVSQCIVQCSINLMFTSCFHVNNTCFFPPEGVLIDAMRKGYWIILDELNLAPTDVLEALNRLLDDNRELFIAETQEVVKAHPRFMLFATQNPPGLYGGRKVSSIHFLNDQFVKQPCFLDLL